MNKCSKLTENQYWGAKTSHETCTFFKKKKEEKKNKSVIQQQQQQQSIF